MSNPLPTKRRKLRKGTHSCWECKRRKAKCVFSNEQDAGCIACRRRGTTCVDQAETEVESETRDGVTNRRLLRIESMLETLFEKQATTGAASINPVRAGEPTYGATT